MCWFACSMQWDDMSAAHRCVDVVLALIGDISRIKLAGKAAGAAAAVTGVLVAAVSSASYAVAAGVASKVTGGCAGLRLGLGLSLFPTVLLQSHPPVRRMTVLYCVLGGFLLLQRLRNVGLESGEFPRGCGETCGASPSLLRRAFCGV